MLQGKTDNYDIDVFEALIGASAALTDTRAEGERRPSHKVIADHLRCSAFLIADGVMPANEGRGYVLRRIMRRAIRHGYKLGQKQPFFHRLVGPLVAEMGDAYPELAAAESHVARTVLAEEERFAETLEAGMRLLDADLALDQVESRAHIRGRRRFARLQLAQFSVALRLLVRQAGVLLTRGRQGFDDRAGQRLDGFAEQDRGVLPCGRGGHRMTRLRKASGRGASSTDFS